MLFVFIITALMKTWKSYGMSAVCVDWLNSILYYNNIIFSAALSIPLQSYTFLKAADTFDTLTWNCFLRGTHYKPEGRGIDSRWYHWNFALT